MVKIFPSFNKPFLRIPLIGGLNTSGGGSLRSMEEIASPLLTKRECCIHVPLGTGKSGGAKADPRFEEEQLYRKFRIVKEKPKNVSSNWKVLTFFLGGIVNRYKVMRRLLPKRLVKVVCSNGCVRNI